MSHRVKKRFEMTPDSIFTYEIDFGENTDGEETGILNDGDTASSVSVSIVGKPSGASDPTLGSVTIGSTTRWIEGRQASANEWAKWTITTASDQDVGAYDMEIEVTTANGNKIPIYQGFEVVPKPS